MKNVKKYQRSPLAIAVLALLAEEPMHPYRMQQLIKERGKDEVINVRQRTNIYQTIERLLREGFITVREVLHEPGRPERTVYEATKKGKTELHEWIRELLSSPAEEFPEFPVALSYLALLTSEDARQQLEKRMATLEQELTRIQIIFDMHESTIPRLFLIEMEYKRTIVSAELQWVKALIDDMKDGTLAWDEAWLREMSQRMGSNH